MNCEHCIYFDYLDNTNEHNFGVCNKHLRLTEISDYCESIEDPDPDKFMYLTEDDYKKLLDWSAKKLKLLDIMAKLP